MQGHVNLTVIYHAVPYHILQWRYDTLHNYTATGVCDIPASNIGIRFQEEVLDKCNSIFMLKSLWKILNFT